MRLGFAGNEDLSGAIAEAFLFGWAGLKGELVRGYLPIRLDLL